MPKRSNNPPPDSATLLEQLLALLRRGGVRSTIQAADELGASLALVETMLEDLARRGYLRSVEAQCARTCAGCAQAGHCAITGGGRVWQIESPEGG